LISLASLSPVPEVDDYRLSDLSSEKTIKKSNTTLHTLVQHEQDHSDEYYKRMETYGSESNYTTVHGNTQGEYSLADQQTDAGESVIISVPTMLRQEDDLRTISDAGDSIYNPNYSIRSFGRNRNTHTRLNYRNKSPMNNTIIIGHCQTEFQPLDPKLLLFEKKPNQCLLPLHQKFYTCSESLELSTYDSGFFDDQTMIHSDQSEHTTNA
jgi:hypothetical protein